MYEVRDVAEGLWLWRLPHPDWEPGLDWEPHVTSVCVESRGEVGVLDPLVPPAEATEIWSRLDRRPPTFAAVLKPDHVRDVDLFVDRYGARFSVVKNTLTRRAAELAGADTLLALLEGPTAIAFLESDGDPVAVAKALVDAARETRVLVVRGGMLEGRPVEPGEIDSLAKLPPVDILRGQVLGAVTAPLTAIVGLFTAPLQDLYGLIDARIEQLQEQGDTSGATAEADAQTAESQAEEAATSESAEEEPEPETQTEEEEQ